MVSVTPETLRLDGDRSHRARRVCLVLVVALVAVSLFSLGWGAAGTSFWRVMADLVAGHELSLQDRVVIFDIRMPRLFLGILVGAALATSGAVMQGLFRNPLADPGLVGVSAGAGLGAIAMIVLAGLLPVAVAQFFGAYLVPVAAFAGGWCSMMILYRIATLGGRTSIATMLLAGIVLGALTGAISGVLIFKANDNQLRELTFWGLGSLAGANWTKLLVAGPVILIALAFSPLLARGLNALALGEAAASHTGVRLQRVKNAAILTVAAATGAAVAVSGGIGFVGIVVPHLLRLATGPDHRWLLINSGLLGAIMLLLADVASRTIVAPAELPIGIITALIGGPVFLWILLKKRGVVDL